MKRISLYFSFNKIWEETLVSNAKVYNGLYSGLQRIADDKARNPEKIIREWCTRTENLFEGTDVFDLCNILIIPSIGNGKYKRYVKKLLKSIHKAGIYQEIEKEIVLTDKNIIAYSEWDGNEIFENDKVEIVNPAWYMNEIIIEQGHCRLIED